MDKNQAQIPALDRGIDLLEWMASCMEAVTLTQIPQGLGFSVSEIQRPVACLNRRGYLNRSEAGTYCLSGHLSALVQRYLHRI
jgi:DNA-binding IclR family transcriptional regulator